MNPDTDTLEARNPAAEAAAAVGKYYDVRVLEPSPPAITDEPFWADDPANPDPRKPLEPHEYLEYLESLEVHEQLEYLAHLESLGGRPVVTPHSGGALLWDELIFERPDLADFAADRWLGARRSLPKLPDNYLPALLDFHRLAIAVVAEARYQVNGKFGLRYTLGGFGTPFFGDDTQVRVVGDRIVVQTAGQARSAVIGSLREAGNLVGVAPGSTAAEHDSPALGDLDRPLDARAEVGHFLGAWFGLATAVLEEMRFLPGTVDPERVQLWPGHFDPAIAAGDAGEGRRATYGFSPGDHSHDEPYLYVAAWGNVDKSDPFWNEENFTGASLSFGSLAASTDHYATALEFMRSGYRRLNDS